MYDIVKTRQFLWGAVLTIKSHDVGKKDFYLLYKYGDKGEFSPCSIMPFHDVIIDELQEVSEILKKLRINPFQKKLREELNNRAILNNLSYKETIKMNFDSLDDERLVLWLCCVDDVNWEKDVRIAAFDFDPSGKNVKITEVDEDKR